MRISPFPLLLLAAVVFAHPAHGDPPLLETDVLPLLQKHCMGCHGGLKQEGGLDLRTTPAMHAGGETGPAVVSGDVEASLLWTRVASDDMPAGKTKLNTEEKAVLRDWIAAKMPSVAQLRAAKQEQPLLQPGKRHEPHEVAAAIDRRIEKTLAAGNRNAAPRSNDDAFLRRIYLDLTGRVPNAEQAAEFLDDPDEDKRAKLIDKLLETPQFGEQFGRTWRDWICPPELPSDQNGGKQPHKEAHELGRWLGERLVAGDSWDKVVRELLLVEGEIKKQPQVIFFGLVGTGGKQTPEGTVRAVASLFMGAQVECAQCHDDPYRDWAQAEYWGLAAFFKNVNGDFKKVTEARNKKSSDIKIPSSAFKNAGDVIPASFLRSDEFDAEKEAAERKRFLEWLTAKENPYFARAFANRMWFYFFSRGIVHPVDDIRELNPPSHPAVLDLLESEFAASGFDVKHLIRCICSSEAYQRTSRVLPEVSDAENAALADQFGRMPLRVMTADMLYDSLKLSYGDPKLDLRPIDPKDGNTNGESAPVADPYLEFLRCFETNEEDATDFTHGIPQMLAMINHPRLLEGSKAIEEYLKAQPAPTPEQTIEWLYLSTLSRRPTAEEFSDAASYVSGAGDTNEAYVALLWTLVNRSEYLFVR